MQASVDAPERPGWPHGMIVERIMTRWRPGGRTIQTAMFLSRWLIVPFLVGLICSVVLIIVRFFINLFTLVTRLLVEPWQDLVVDVLNLIDLTLMANLVLIVAFSAYGNYIRKIDDADRSDWPPGLIDIDFSEMKQKLLGSIAGIAAVDSLAWYLDLEDHADTAKLAWVIAFPLMFVAAMVLLAVADWLGRRR
jgi:uncharacterized protein (TIGR00645 family)